jgi:asparagine synthetase B (glutamine-hydrolysing)
MIIDNFLFVDIFPKGGMKSEKMASAHGLNYDFNYLFGNLTPISIKEDENRILIVLGHPSYDVTINFDKFIVNYISGDFDLSQINGEFLIVDFNKKNDKLSVINSRFGAPMVFYALLNNRIILSTSYAILAKTLISNKFAKINSVVFYELLRFRRVFNNHTFDTVSKYLPVASNLKWSSDGRHSINKYWTHDYTKNNNSLIENAEILNHLVKESIQYKTSDKKKYGIMQSGGLDTRFVMSNFSDPPHAFTTTYEKNREYQVAKKIAGIKGAEHTWIQINSDRYKNNFDKSSFATGAMYMADSMFYGFNEIIRKECDVIFSGFGMDYFFQGMYLPSKTVSIFGNDLPWYKRIDTIKGNMVDYFIDHISYYTKGASIDLILSNNQSIDMNDWIEYSISSQLNEAKKYSDNIYDVWEHMSLGDLSRHYTHGGQLAMSELTQHRVVGYTNDLLDLYTSIPVEQRFDARVLRKALYLSNKRLYKLISANHGYPAGASSAQKCIYHIKKYWPEKVGLKQKKRNFERTWLTSEEILRQELYDKVVNLPNSQFLNELGIVDTKRLSSVIKSWKSGNTELNQTAMVLLTIDSFYSQIVS